MTTAWPPRTGPEVPARTGGAIPEEGAARNAPVVLLTYGNAGGRRLQSLLESEPELTCTTSTGVLAACEHAAAAWRQLEGRPAKGLSPLAVRSVRAMATQMITSVTVRTGRSRWCELAAAEPSAAEAFLQVFPGTRFVCLHRACPDLVSEVLLASPWGLSGAAFAPYVVTYPGSAVAALAAWWAAHASPVLTFERAHPGACMRLHYEDLAADPDAARASVRAFLGLAAPAQAPAGAPAPEPAPAQAPAGAPDREPGADLPLEQIPPALLAQVNQLHAELGYPRLGAS
jgi:hypothetical protein